MSMPSFPEDCEISREQAFNMIIASIAMEELALSHILNAEGEKLQYVLGTLPNAPRCPATTKELLDINKSISNLLDVVMQNQILLKGKLERVLDSECFCEHHNEHGGDDCNSRHDCEKGSLQLSGQSCEISGEQSGRLCFSCLCSAGDSIGFCESRPWEIILSPGRRYQISYTFNLRALSCNSGSGRIFLKESPCCACNALLPQHFSTSSASGRVITVNHSAVLTPCECHGQDSVLEVMLSCRDGVYIEKGSVSVVEL